MDEGGEGWIVRVGKGIRAERWVMAVGQVRVTQGGRWEMAGWATVVDEWWWRWHSGS